MRIQDDKYLDPVIERLIGMKRIKATKEEAKDVLEKLFNYIEWFNAVIDDDIRVLDNHFVEDWLILSEFKDFLTPSSIRFDAGNKRWKDLKVQNSYKAPKDFVPTYSEFESYQASFRGFLRKDFTSDFISLRTLKEPVSLTSYVDYVSIDGKCRAIEKPVYHTEIIPECKILLSDNSLFIQETEADDLLYLDDWLIK